MNKKDPFFFLGEQGLREEDLIMCLLHFHSNMKANINANEAQTRIHDSVAVEIRFLAKLCFE